MKGCRSKAVLEANKEAVKAVFLFSQSCGNADASIFTVTETTANRRFHLEDDAPLGAVRSGRHGVGAVPVRRSCVAGTASASLSRRHRRQLACGPTARGLPAFRNAAGTTCKRSEHCICVQAACGPQFTVVLLRNQGRLLNLCLRQCGTMSKMPSKHTVDFARLLHESRSAKSGLRGSRQPKMIAQKLIVRSVLCKHAKSRDWNYSSNFCLQT